MSRIVEDITIPMPWGFIKGKWWGPRNQRPVLCIHGWQDNIGTFKPLLSLLSNKVSFLCIDLPGHGLSSHMPDGQPPYIWWDNVIIVRRIVKYFGWNTVSIMGHSLGGAVGFLYAASFPDEIDLLIALDSIAPIFSCRPEEIADDTAGIIDSFLHYDSIKFTKDPVDTYSNMVDIALAGHKDSLTRKSCEILLERGMIPVDGANYKFTRDNRLKAAWLAKPSFELVTEFASRIKCKYLNIRALSGKPSTVWPIYQQILQLIQKSSRYFKYAEVKGTHHVHLNEPEKVAPIITEFLTKNIE